MIKKQYIRYAPNTYFGKFVNTTDDTLNSLRVELSKYQATIAKSKNYNAKINVKWHNEKLYTLFVLRWS
jgi:hypothetical protein